MNIYSASVVYAGAFRMHSGDWARRRKGFVAVIVANSEEEVLQTINERLDNVTERPWMLEGKPKVKNIGVANPDVKAGFVMSFSDSLYPG